MSLNKNIYKYSIRCSSEDKLVYCWDELTPQVCPNNTSHLIDLNSVKIIDTVIQNSVNIIQSTGATGNNYRVEFKKLTIPGNSEIYKDYTWDFPIELMTINWIADTSHINDIINGYIAPNTTIGAITSKITVGDTLINVSSSVLKYISIGHVLNITNGVSNILMGEVKRIDKINNTILACIPANINMETPSYVQMTIHNIKDAYLMPGILNLASKRITSSLLPTGTKARLKYRNNGNIEKDFIFYVEIMY